MKRFLKRGLSVVISLVMIFSVVSVGGNAALPILDLTFNTGDATSMCRWEGSEMVGTLTFNANDANKNLAIGSCYFQECPNLTSIKFMGDEGKILVGYMAFYNCDKLESIIFEGDVKVEFTDDECFFGCDALKEVYLPKTVTVQDEEDLFDGPFYAEDIFGYCDNLEKVTLDCGPIPYADGMFDSCVNLKTIEILSEEITVLPSSFAAACPLLETVILPETLKCINRGAIRSSSLKNISLPEGLETLHSLDYCNSLKNLYIPSSVTSIKDVGMVRNPEYTGTNDDVPTTIPRRDDFAIYGHTDSVAETYAQENEFTFIPVESLTSSSITSTQNNIADIGTETDVTISVAGFPDTLTLKGPSDAKTVFAREEAEIVKSEKGEAWTVKVTPESETANYAVTASYCGGDLTAESTVTVKANVSVVYGIDSAETVKEAIIGSFATVNVKVNGEAQRIRFVNENADSITVLRNGGYVNSITSDGTTETWEVKIPVSKESESFKIYGKFESGWSEKSCDFTLNAKAADADTKVFSMDIAEDEELVVYQGINEVKIVTADSASKVQFKKGNLTLTYNEENAEYKDTDGKREWTINVPFTDLGENTYEIRVRTPKTTFETAETLNILVYAK